ncbi:MAG: SMI1/KNR4 family protein [Thermoguttaceae bacterium]|nr:SMI1/KNR4 family protein [Thermoguttaceae bacterium]
MAFFISSKKRILKDLETCERKYLKKKLPDELRDFFLEYAGVEPSLPVFKICGLDNTPDDAISSFIGGKDEPLSECFEIYQGRIPENFVPIAYGDMGDLVCYSIDDGDLGHIWYWYHEEEREAGKVDRSNCYSCANSLTEFLENLSEDEDDGDEDEDKADPYYLLNLLTSFMARASQEALAPLGFTTAFVFHWKKRELPSLIQWLGVEDVHSKRPAILAGYTIKLDLTLWKESASKRDYRALEKFLDKLYSSETFCYKTKSWTEDYVKSSVDKEIGEGWKERGSKKEIDRGIAPFLAEVKEYVAKEVVPIFAKYDSDVKIFEEYKNGRVSLNEIAAGHTSYYDMYKNRVERNEIPWRRVSPYLYLASYSYKLGALIEASYYLQLWRARAYEPLENKNEDSAKLWKRLVDSAMDRIEKEYEKTDRSKTLAEAVNELAEARNKERERNRELFERLEEEGSKHEKLFGI